MLRACTGCVALPRLLVTIEKEEKKRAAARKSPIYVANFPNDAIWKASTISFTISVSADRKGGRPRAIGSSRYKKDSGEANLRVHDTGDLIRGFDMGAHFTTLLGLQFEEFRIDPCRELPSASDNDTLYLKVTTIQW